MLRVLIGCEASGVVRRAFAKRGHDVWSCDLEPSEDRSNRHIIDDVRNLLKPNMWDLLVVLHPPCTRLTNSGVRWLTDPPGQITSEYYSKAQIEAYKTMTREQRLYFMWQQLREGAALFSACLNAPVKRVAVENPVMHKHAKALIKGYKPATQIVQPWWFGEPAFKATGLYLRGLPPLVETNKLTPPQPGTPEHKEWSFIHLMPPGPLRSKLRSRTFDGVGEAMAEQWGGYALQQEAA
jgi:hypothetical protein